MMNQIYRLIQTAVLFMIAGAIHYNLVDDNLYNHPGDIISMTLLLALICVFIVWVLPSFQNGMLNKISQMRATSKPKREVSSSKYDLLLQLMDEDEREAFKQTLKRQALNDMRLGEDGELPDYAEMLADDYRYEQGSS